MFQSGMMPGNVRNSKTRPAVAKATLQNKTAQESGRSGESNPQAGSTLAVFQHLPRAEWRISLCYHLPVMVGIAHRVVQEITSQRVHPGSLIHGDGFVDNTITPTPARPIEKTKLIVGVPTATANPTTHVECAAGYAISVCESRFITL